MFNSFAIPPMGSDDANPIDFGVGRPHGECNVGQLRNFLLQCIDSTRPVVVVFNLDNQDSTKSDDTPRIRFDDFKYDFWDGILLVLRDTWLRTNDIALHRMEESGEHNVPGSIPKGVIE